MSDEDRSIWAYNPSFPLVVHRAWFYSAVVVGAAVEVAGYACRAYSAKNQTVL
ncbi:hypothetical protein MY3296_009857, partial [Beauveria thailandica]